MRLPGPFREWTKKFASAIIRLYAQLPRARRNVQVLGHQLLRAGTSVAAHVREASRARSDAEFDSEAIEQLYQETNELIAILATMASKTRRNLR
ncbi:MAG: four helix bundle protein [Chthoniobacterales bacterium]